MSRRLVECVPNFSEGRDAGTVARIAGAIRAVPGVALLDVESDADHNRSVITFAAPPELVVEAALAGAAEAIRSIDLTRHTGAHPRIGALDVLPFVPLEGVTLEECVALARKAASELWKRFQVPCYLYEAAAQRTERANLEAVRRGQFEGLRDEVRINPDRAPDFGHAELHPTAGATAVGARKFLIAYNIHLNTSDVEIARRIARAIRHSSGGFRYVKAMGLLLESRNVAQVSMNLTDFEQTPVHRVFAAVAAEAARYGATITGSELIGLIPQKALEMSADFFLRFENFQPSLVLERRLAEKLPSGLNEFLDRLAAPTAAPGGGSAAAAAGAMAAALGAMVARLAKLPADEFEQDRLFFSEAVERDAEAFQQVMAAYRRPKEERAPFVEEAMLGAALVPLEVSERALALSSRLTALGQQSAAKFASDVSTGRALADACLRGARANIEINLAELQSSPRRTELEERAARLPSV
jgi:glutamate formiminotransferase